MKATIVGLIPGILYEWRIEAITSSQSVISNFTTAHYGECSSRENEQYCKSTPYAMLRTINSCFRYNSFMVINIYNSVDPPTQHRT